MAGNKMSNKGRTKEDKTKSNKNGAYNTDDPEDVDFSLLRKPIVTSITGFAQARNIFDLATEELKQLLTNECDLLYECKVCRNIFRSLANFISHKRVYCKEKFNTSTHGHFIKSMTLASELSQIRHMEEAYQESLKNKNDTNIEEDKEPLPLTKDLTTIVENLTKNKGVEDTVLDDVQQVTLQKISSSSVAVFQNVPMEEQSDNMKSQVMELDEILSKNKAVLLKDGTFDIESSKKNAEQENVIQISDDEEMSDTILKCKICNLQFSTQKTLKFHVKHKHLESRLVYPCPDCVDIFSTSWSVYRHLFKVHRKSAAQIRRLRESIQSKAFRMDNPTAYYEKKKNSMKLVADKKITEEERLDQENQAWMENMESDLSAPRCGGCGRSFERRAALTAHTHTCQPRSRALARRSRIEIQIRKDYPKEPPAVSPSPPPSPPPSPQPDDPPPSRFELEDWADRVDDNERALRLKIQQSADVDLAGLVCGRCGARPVAERDLLDHVAAHYKWERYACKLCNHKEYELPAMLDHVQAVHKLRGDADFYHTMVKVVGGAEAREAAEWAEAAAEGGGGEGEGEEAAPPPAEEPRTDPRRKRKSQHPKQSAKKKKDCPDDSEIKNSSITMDKVLKAFIYGESEPNIKSEENSDMDEIEDKIAKTTDNKEPAMTRRPVRKRTKPKNEDFEYDLSNLLKMEAQGYREYQNVSITKTMQSKKKPQLETPTSSEHINKDFIGALFNLSKCAVELSAAHLKPYDMSIFKAQKEQRLVYPFTKPLIPKPQSKPDKISPRKESVEDKDEDIVQSTKTVNNAKSSDTKNKATGNETNSELVENGEKSKDSITTLGPFKLRRQSIEIMKSSIINKHITDLSKVGMKTKVLVIKPINRNKDKCTAINKPMQFQTIKLKDPTTKSNENKSDQVVVVKVPNVINSNLTKELNKSIQKDDSISNTTNKVIENIQDNDNKSSSSATENPSLEIEEKESGDK